MPNQPLQSSRQVIKVPICASLWTWFLKDTNTNSSHILHWLWHGLQKTHTNFSHLLYQLWHVSQKIHTNFTHLFFLLVMTWFTKDKQFESPSSSVTTIIQPQTNFTGVLLSPPPPPPPPSVWFSVKLVRDKTHTGTHTHTCTNTTPLPHAHTHTCTHAHPHTHMHKVCRLNVNTLLPLLPACLQFMRL